MRNTLLAISPLIIFLLSCRTSPDSPQSVYVFGEIVHPKGETISFHFGEVSETDSLDGSGKFKAILTIDQAQEVSFRHGEEFGRLYVRPGDQVHLSLDTDLFDETLTFTGDAAAINNYLASMTLLEDTLMGFRALMMLDEADFLHAQDSIIDLKLSFLDGISDQEFIDYIQEQNFWNKYKERLIYESYHAHLLDLPRGDFKVSEGFYDFKTRLDVNDSTKLKYPAYHGYASELVRNAAGALRSNLPYYEGYVVAMDSLVTLERLKEDLYFSFFTNYFSSLPANFASEQVAKWRELHPDEHRVEQITEMMTVLAKLEPGNPAPDFAFESLDGDTLGMSDFLGRVVYIDVWATWCGPCIGEHPYLEELQEEFKDENVTFVSVSIDNTKEPWEKMVHKKQLGGVHLYAPGGWKAQIMESYMINGIPRFILVDQEGNIVSSDAPRPSGAIAEELKQLLKPA